AHDVLLVEQNDANIRPAWREAPRNLQHELAVACAEVRNRAWRLAAGVLAQQASHPAGVAHPGVDPPEIAPRADRARIVGRQLIGQFRFQPARKGHELVAPATASVLRAASPASVPSRMNAKEISSCCVAHSGIGAGPPTRKM